MQLNEKKVSFHKRNVYYIFIKDQIITLNAEEVSMSGKKVSPVMYYTALLLLLTELRWNFLF